MGYSYNVQLGQSVNFVTRLQQLKKDEAGSYSDFCFTSLFSGGASFNDFPIA